uniref:ATP-dependent DNA helicase n=1 Tax=Amphimedon queenslandica TaxID=400682 RepID=A0A1X7VSS2_AMPQE
MSCTKYLIIDEMSMVGRKTFGMIDCRLRQAFYGKSQIVFGGCSILLFGDFGQLPPVMDLPIYTTVTQSDLSNQGYKAHSQFETAFTLTQVMRQSGQDRDQIRFHDILMHLRNGHTTEDWNHLMDQTPIEAVVDHNVAMLRECGHPIATIKAVHTEANAAKAPSDDAGGMEPVVMLAKSARVMLPSNLWVEVGLVNEAMGTVEAICYKETTPHIPVAVMVWFDRYTAPTVHDATVQITPVVNVYAFNYHSREVTIHKSQGLTQDKAVINEGKKEFSCEVTFVACSKVRKLKDILFMPPFPLQSLKSIANSKRLQKRKENYTCFVFNS